MTIPSWDGAEFVASDGGYSKYSPRIVALAEGNFAVIWSGFRFASDDPDQGAVPIARLFDADRNPLGAGFAIPDDVDGMQDNFVVSATADGGFAVAYTEMSAGSDPGTFLARFDKTGARVAADAKISDDARVVGLAGLSDGSMMVLREAYGASRGIVATIVDGSNAVGATDVATGASPVGAGGANIATAIGDTAAFVTLTGGSSARGATLHVIGSDGQSDSATELYSGETGNGMQVARVLADGRAVVAQAVEAGGEPAVRVRLFDVDGTLLSDEQRAVDPDRNDPEQIVGAPDGGFVVLMITGDINARPDTTEVQALKFDAQGAAEGPAFQLNRNQTGEQARPQGAWLEDGDFIAVWQDAPSPYAVQVTAQGFDPSGTTAGHAPTDIVLSGDPIQPGVQGQAIGKLSAVDADAGDEHVFEFASYAGAFELDGDVLRFNLAVSPVEAYHGSVEIRVTDSQFNTYVETLEIAFASSEPESVTRIGGRGDDKLIGKGGDDLLKGLRGHDKLLGRAGDDDLKGGGGRDKLLGQSGDDRLFGGGGRDKLMGHGGADRLFGGAGPDVMMGHGGADRLFGGGGRDVLMGHAGRDRLDGGRGIDKLIGGGGADVFVLDGKAGPDRVKDYADGLDRIEIASGAEQFDDLRLVRRGDDVLIKDGQTKLGLIEDVSRGDLDGSDFLFS